MRYDPNVTMVLLIGLWCSACNPSPPSSPPDQRFLCSNGVQDGDETDVDCGGQTCRRCDRGETCGADTDCTGLCDTARCRLPRSCAELHQKKPNLGDGTYVIAPTGTQSSLSVRCDMTAHGGGWTLFASIVGGGFNYKAVSSNQFGTDNTESTFIASKPSETKARLVVSGKGFSLDLGQTASSDALMPSQSDSYANLNFDTVNGQDNASIFLETRNLMWSSTLTGYKGGALVGVFGGWGSRIGSYSYNRSPLEGCNNVNTGIVWVLQQQIAGGGYLSKNTMDISDHLGCNNVATGQIANQVQLYYR